MQWIKQVTFFHLFKCLSDAIKPNWVVTALVSFPLILLLPHQLKFINMYLLTTSKQEGTVFLITEVPFLLSLVFLTDQNLYISYCLMVWDLSLVQKLYSKIFYKNFHITFRRGELLNAFITCPSAASYLIFFWSF